jgi:hypothetical protein
MITKDIDRDVLVAYLTISGISSLFTNNEYNEVTTM